MRRAGQREPLHCGSTGRSRARVNQLLTCRNACSPSLQAVPSAGSMGEAAVGPLTAALLAQLAEEVVEAGVLEGTFGCAPAMLAVLCCAEVLHHAMPMLCCAAPCHALLCCTVCVL